MVQVIRRRGQPAKPLRRTPPVGRFPIKPGDFVSTEDYTHIPVFAVANPGQPNEFIVASIGKRHMVRFHRTEVTDCIVNLTPSGSHVRLAPGPKVVATPIVRRRR